MRVQSAVAGVSASCNRFSARRGPPYPHALGAGAERRFEGLLKDVVAQSQHEVIVDMLFGGQGAMGESLRFMLVGDVVGNKCRQ